MSSPVIVTGVTSFVGMHLARHYAAAGARVVGVTSRPLDSYDGIRAQRIKALAGLVDLHVADLTEPKAVSALVENVAPSLCLHHAGFVTGYASPDYDLATGLAVNVVALSHLYQALAGGNCGVIVTGSSAEYSPTDLASTEDDPCWPDTAYGLAKLAETIRARQLAERHAIPTRVTRLFIPFGTFDHPDKLMAQVVTGLRSGRPVELSPCDQRRDFLGVSDICRAYQALERDLPRVSFDIFNICSGEALELRSFLLGIAERMGADPALLQFGRRSMRPGETPIFYGSNAKAARLLNWRPSERMAAIDRDLLAPAA